MGRMVRPADPARDAAACAAIYAPSVTDGFASFEEVAPGADEMAARIAGAHLWLVDERDADQVAPLEAAGLRARAVPLMMSDHDATAAMAAAAVRLAAEVAADRLHHVGRGAAGAHEPLARRAIGDRRRKHRPLRVEDDGRLDLGGDLGQIGECGGGIHGGGR